MHKNFFYFMSLPLIGFFMNKNKDLINLNITFGSFDDNLIIEIEKNNSVKGLKDYLKSYHNLGEIGDKIFYKGTKLEDKFKLSSYGIQNGDLIEIVLRDIKK